MKKKNVASMAMAAMMAAGALPMNAWAAPEVNHDEPLTIEVYDVQQTIRVCRLDGTQRKSRIVSTSS